MDTSGLTLIHQTRWKSLVANLHVKLHVTQNGFVVKPLVVMRHAKSEGFRARGVRTNREAEVECAHDTLHIHPKRPDVTGAAEHFGVGRGCQLCIQKQPDEFHTSPSPVLLLQAISLSSHLSHLIQGHRCNNQVLGVQHLSCMRHLQHLVHFHQRLQAQPTTRSRRVKKLGGGRLWQAKQMSQPSLHSAIKSLELGVQWAQMAKHILDLGVDICLQRLHHLPYHQARLHECYRLSLEPLNLGF